MVATYNFGSVYSKTDIKWGGGGHKFSEFACFSGRGGGFCRL